MPGPPRGETMQPDREMPRRPYLLRVPDRAELYSDCNSWCIPGEDCLGEPGLGIVMYRHHVCGASPRSARWLGKMWNLYSLHHITHSLSLCSSRSSRKHRQLFSHSAIWKLALFTVQIALVKGPWKLCFNQHLEPVFVSDTFVTVSDDTQDLLVMVLLLVFTFLSIFSHLIF